MKGNTVLAKYRVLVCLPAGSNPNGQLGVGGTADVSDPQVLQVGMASWIFYKEGFLALRLLKDQMMLCAFYQPGASKC